MRHLSVAGRSALLLLYFILFTVSLKAQVTREDASYWEVSKKGLSDTSKKEIDPRRYVQVLYKKNQNFKAKERADIQRIIWQWDSSGFYQKYKVLDNEGFVEIYFKKDELAQNYNFQGNISLVATIKGKDGERKIEVEPYSLVGENRKEIGIESFPATTVAQLLFNTMIEMKRTIVSVNLSKYDDALFQQENIRSFTNIAKNLKEYDKKVNDKIDTLDNNFSFLKPWAFHPFYPSLIKYATRPGDYSYLQLATDLEYAAGSLENYFMLTSDSIRSDFTFLLKRIALINNYLTAFEQAGPDAVKAFLDIASKDKINFKFLRERLKEEQTQLEFIVADSKTNGNLLLLTSKTGLEHAREILKILNTFSAIQGSRVEQIIKSGYVFDRNILEGSESVRKELEEEGIKIPDTVFSANFYRINADSIIYNKYSRYIQLRLLEKSAKFEEFKQKLSVIAADIMYRKLVYATINLAKSGAQPGDVLYLNVVWKNIDGENDSAKEKSSLLNIGTYELRETGWKTRISESFYLVERINEPDPSTDPNVSTSNFKGAYGASIMRTFYFNEGYRRNFGGRLMNFLQPSVGFNLSYVDFYTNKDIEIGVGLQLGLFKNIFFFGSGINLHGIRKDEKKSAAYFMFGVSFTNIAAKFKGNDKQEE